MCGRIPRRATVTCGNRDAAGGPPPTADQPVSAPPELICPSPRSGRSVVLLPGQRVGLGVDGIVRVDQPLVLGRDLTVRPVPPGGGDGAATSPPAQDDQG